MDNEKVTTLAEAAPLNVEEKKEKEMELVDASTFENVIAKPVEVEEIEEMYALAGEMVKFAHARGGIGLALPQIGISKRAFIFLENDNQWQMIINPEYFGSGKKPIVYERSLSYDGVYAMPRFKRINVVYYTIDVDKNDRLVLKKNTKMMSGLKAFVYQMLVGLLDGKTARLLGTYIETEKEEENGQQQG